jgi:hypothetical protein
MKLATIAALILSLTVAAFIPARAEAAGGLAIPVTGTAADGVFTGTFTLQKFVPTATGVQAVGTLTGSIVYTAGTASQSVVQIIVLPVDIGQTTCEILHLDLGPLSLDLLGLQVDLSRIVLDITAQSGAGKLLGNLLCAVAGLLDNPSALAKLLNDILAILA